MITAKGLPAGRHIFLEATYRMKCARSHFMRENCTCSLSGGRRPAWPQGLRASSDPTKSSRTMGVPVPGRRQSGPNGGFFLSRNRDVNAAKSFLRSAMKNTRVPTKITLDAYAASHRAVREMKESRELPGRVQIRSSQYLNNLVEQDHRRVKQRIRPMLGFKRFDNAVVTISGIELAEKIKKGQFKTGKLGGCNATMTELWNAALAA